MSLGGAVVRRRAGRSVAAFVSGVLGAVLITALTPATPAAGGPAVGGATGSARLGPADEAGPQRVVLRYKVVQQQRVRLEIGAAAQVRRIRAVRPLPRNATVRNGALHAWVGKGARKVFKFSARSTAQGQRGRRVRLKVVVLGEPAAARAGSSLLSRGPGGRPGNGPSYGVHAAGDGSAVVFTTWATNLLDTPLPARELTTSGYAMAWDRATGDVELVSVAPDGTPMGGVAVGVSADGSRVLFTSDKSAYLRDRRAGTTRLVASGIDGADLSSDGNLVTYLAAERALRFDLRTGLTEDLGTPGYSAVSANGRYLAVSERTRAYIWDVTTRTVVRETALDLEDFCYWRMTELSNDTQLGVLFRGCDRANADSLVATGTLVQDPEVRLWADTIATDADFTWAVAADARARVDVRPVGGAPMVVSERPAGFGAQHQVTAAVSAGGSSVAWSARGTDIVRGSTSPHTQVYIWTSGR